jgi:hypothetical protein
MNINWNMWYNEEFEEFDDSMILFNYLNTLSYGEYTIKIPFYNNNEFYKKLYKNITNYTTCIKYYSNYNRYIIEDFYIFVRYNNNEIVVTGWERLDRVESYDIDIKDLL